MGAHRFPLRNFRWGLPLWLCAGLPGPSRSPLPARWPVPSPVCPGRVGLPACRFTPGCSLDGSRNRKIQATERFFPSEAFFEGMDWKMRLRRWGDLEGGLKMRDTCKMGVMQGYDLRFGQAQSGRGDDPVTRPGRGATDNG